MGNGLNGTIVYNTGPTGAGIGWAPGKEWGFDRRLRVSVDVRVERLNRTSVTTEHEQVEGALSFAITWNVWHPAGHDIVGFGRDRDFVDPMTEFMQGFDQERVEALWQLGDRWHLNHARAGCAHQDVVWEDSTYGRRPSLYRDVIEDGEVVGWAGTMPCPVSGYRYGTSWLVEVLPDSFMDDLRGIFSKSRSPIYDLGAGVV